MKKGKGKETGMTNPKGDDDDEAESHPAKRPISDDDILAHLLKKSLYSPRASTSQPLHVGPSAVSRSPGTQDTSGQASLVQQFTGIIMINGPAPPWAPGYESPCLVVRENELREQFRQAGIPTMPNYRVYDLYITRQGWRTFDDLLDYTRDRLWLEKYTSYKQISRQQWRQHGFRSKVFSQRPDISSAEARALKLWVENIKADFVTFERVTGTTPPEKYWAVIYGFAHNVGNERYL